MSSFFRHDEAMPGMPLPLRTASSADADAILPLVRAAYARWVPLIGREPRPMLADYAVAAVTHRIDLVEHKAGIVGLIETALRADHLWIENIAVAPEHQKQGIGRTLLAHAETLARQARRSELRLLTNAAFESNVALYLGTGYAIAAREPFMGGTTLYLRKQLAAD
jgi:GNAT superfamily N-acetyltransferase